nr:SapC family protein [uncultured Brevundimonas sp.]
MTTPTQEASALPLFYRDPQPLSSAAHAEWRLLDGDVSFAADTAYAPIVVGELAAASAAYPVLFSGDTVQPIVVLGLQQSNLFVTNGRWDPAAYVPAYVRRYPFGFIATVNPEGFALAIDAGSDRVVKTDGEGAPLFEDGKPSELTRQALSFCDAFQGEAAATQAFGQALKAQDLLIDRRADATLKDGRKLGLDGFQIVDVERFNALPDDVVIDWHRKGWLAMVHFHLASLDRFRNLLDRMNADGSNVIGASPRDASASVARPKAPATKTKFAKA